MRWLMFLLLISPAQARDKTFDNLEGQLIPQLEAAGCFIDKGLIILDPQNKSTWSVIYDATTSQNQKDACAKVINDFKFIPSKKAK